VNVEEYMPEEPEPDEDLIYNDKDAPGDYLQTGPNAERYNIDKIIRQ